MAKSKVILAFLISSILSLLVGLLSNMASSYIAPEFAKQPWMIGGALSITFLISLPISLYLFLHSVAHQDSHAKTVESQETDAKSLPPKPYQRFFGRDALIDELLAALRDPAGKWMIGIDGLGGIGKTSLARELAERCLDEKLFDPVMWEPQSVNISYGTLSTLDWPNLLVAIGRQLGAPDMQRLSDSEREARLAQLLHAQKVLLVLDNLEIAVWDQDELARRLRPFLSPSKVLMTSRRRFKGDLYSVHLGGLDEESSLLLIRYEAKEKGSKRVTDAQTSDLRKIVQTTGGSPLALKLLVGQLQHLALQTVLDALRDVQIDDDSTDQGEYVRFYKSIFWNSWSLLSEEAQRLLISMSIFAPGVGGTFEAIKATSRLSEKILPLRIDELWRLSFLEVGESGLKKPRYSLHPLTQYFVLSDIVKTQQ